MKKYFDVKGFSHFKINITHFSRVTFNGHILNVRCSNNTKKMNSLETEYSFLSPTWKLPSFGGTSSIYTPPKLSSDAVSGQKKITESLLFF